MREAPESHRTHVVGKAAIVAVATVAAFFALANAVALNGYPAAPLRALGNPFFAADEIAASHANSFILPRQQLPAETVAEIGELPPPPSAEEMRASAIALLGFDSIDSLAPTLASFAASEAGDEVRAARLIERAVDLSRRNRMAQFWLMQHSLRQGDLKATLSHFDLLLRSVADPPTELFVQLVPIIQNPEGRAALMELLRRDPNWKIAMLESLVASSPQAEPVARLIAGPIGTLPRGARASAIYASLVSRLADEGATDVLKEVYPLLPGSNSELWRQVAFPAEPAPADFAPVAWRVGEGANINANVLRASADEGATYLLISATPAHSGVAASKLVAPGPGRQLVFAVRSLNERSNGRLAVAATCPGASRPFAATENLLGSGAETRHSLSLAGGCDVVRIDILASGGTGSSPMEAEIRQIGLAPAR